MTITLVRGEKDLRTGLHVARAFYSVYSRRMPDQPRCSWATTEAMIAYHDTEWGVPQHDDRVLFEFLILEGAQAGLSWSTILAKRAAYRKAFSNFDPRKVARYKAEKLSKLLANPGIVRNRLKISAAVRN